MSEKRAGGIVASSFVAGLLLAAGIFAPRAWEPVPEPYFGLDEGGSAEPHAPVIVGGRRDEPLPSPRAPVDQPSVDRTGQNAPSPIGERLALAEPADRVTAVAVQSAAIAAREAVNAAPVEIPPPSATADIRSSTRSADQQPGYPPAVVSSPVIVAAPEAAVQERSAPTNPAPAPESSQPNPDSLRALVTRVQSTRPAVAIAPPLPRRITPPPAAEALPSHDPTVSDVIGAAPLPGPEWVDPDSVNWSEPPLVHPAAKPTVPVPRLGIRPRLRVAERLLGRDRTGQNDGSSTLDTDSRSTLPDIRLWPTPHRLLQQLDQLSTTTPAHESSTWAGGVLEQLQALLQMSGPRDDAAQSSLVGLGDSVHSGMGIADATTDHALGSATRRAALALARRVAVWRAATALCSTVAEGDGRIETEVARLLDAVERYESSTAPEDAAVAARSTHVLSGVGLPGADGLARAIRDHYLSANVRIAIHQPFLERLLPGATVTSGPVDDVVMGRKVRGTRTVHRTTTVRFVPDSDEICFDLEVHGDVESRTVTDAGPVSVTAHGDSSFTVRKPIKVSSVGLLFGTATGVASNRSQLSNVQTSFDSVPIMRSLVRNMARNQHEETLPEANREVIDHIVSRACREVDAQAEPKFVEVADRIRDRVWGPLVRLGLEPTPVAMETTATTATLRLRLAAQEQLAAHTPRPRAPADSLFSLQLHESTINNAIERLGLAGRRFTIEDLITMLCERAGVETRLPDDLPDGVHVTFARRQPVRVECRDGLVHVRIALDAIESGRRSWYDVVAQVSYKPATASPQVFLEREGPVQLSGPGHQGRIEVALRTIFSKIFPKERPIAVLPERLVKNPRLDSLHVLQAVSTDGWLALALGLRDGEATVARPAADDGRKADLRPRIFR